MSFITTKRTIGFKLESVAGIAEILAATDYDLCATEVSYDPEVQMYARKCAKGDYSHDVSIAGKRSCKVTFKVDFREGATIATAPNYFKCYKSCAVKETVYGATGIGLSTNADYSNVTATIEIVERDEGTAPSQVVVKVKGAMGNVKTGFNSVGEPINAEFEFTGVLSSIEDRAFGSLLTPTAFDTNLPQAVLSATVTAFGESQVTDKMTIDLGNDVQLFTDPSDASGYSYAHVVARRPVMEMDPDLDLIANKANYARWTGNTTGALSVMVGDNLELSAPTIQFQKTYTPGDREGHVTSESTFELQRGTNGNDEFEILQGSKT